MNFRAKESLKGHTTFWPNIQLLLIKKIFSNENSILLEFLKKVKKYSQIILLSEKRLRCMDACMHACSARMFK